MSPHDEFVAGLAERGASPTTVGSYIVYEVEVVGGRFDGQVVRTGVAVSEVSRWPLVPPHWIHLPDDVRFARTNTQACGLSGWTGHSRKIAGWGSDVDPTAGWLAHVRGVISEAI